MVKNFKCPRCKQMQVVGKKLRSSWTCPHCHITLLLTREIVNKGYMPYRKNFMLMNTRTKPFKKPLNKINSKFPSHKNNKVNNINE